MIDPSKMMASLPKEAMMQPPKCVCGPGVDETHDWSRWHVIYPNYIDADKTMSCGRRLPKTAAVSAPRIEEMFEVCCLLGLPTVMENKHYSRDWMVRGRLRVQVFRDDTGTSPATYSSAIKKTDSAAKKIPINTECTSKAEVMKKISAAVLGLKSRTNPQHPQSSTTGVSAPPTPVSTGAGAKATASTAKSSHKKKGKR
eukprot:Lankesteria_metandrocarpae@DN891_c0_g1_i1.p1